MGLTLRPCQVCGRPGFFPSGECAPCKAWGEGVRTAVRRQEQQFRESCCDGGGYEKLPTHLR